MKDGILSFLIPMNRYPKGLIVSYEPLTKLKF